MTATKLLDALDEMSDPMSAMEAFTIPPTAAADWAALLPVFRALRAPASDWPAEFEIVTRWYEPQPTRIYEDG